MKKLFLLLPLVITMTACHDASGPSTAQMDSADAKAIADTLKATADTAVKKIDSAIGKAADSVKSKLNAKADSVKRAIRK